jgi:hypothetical protein
MYYSRLDFIVVNHARRAFWTCFVLDKDISLKTGLLLNLDNKVISINYLDLIVPATSLTGTSPGAGP